MTIELPDDELCVLAREYALGNIRLDRLRGFVNHIAIEAARATADQNAFALQALVAAGHVSQGKVDEALSIAAATPGISATADHRDSADAINVAIALERVRALEIVAAVKAEGFSKSETEIPTQAESVFDLACEEIDYRLRNETWGLNGVSAPETIECAGQPLSIDQIVRDAKRFACYWAGRSRANRDEAEAEFRRALKSQQDAAIASRDPIRALIAAHAEQLEQNDYAYFELAYTRRTGWMAWLCSNSRDDDPTRKVLAKGQGDTPEEACAAAIASPRSGNV